MPALKKHFAVQSRTGFVVAAALLVGSGALADAASAENGLSVHAETASAIPAGAVISPDGRRAIWTDADRSGFWATERKSPEDGWRVPEHILQVRGVVRSAVFSPDGKKLAFENIRGGDATGGYRASRQFQWAFIGVFDFEHGRLDYLSPSFGRDTAPRWSADGKQVSFWRKMEGVPARQITASIPDDGATPVGSRTEQAPVAAFLSAPLVYQPAVSGDGRTFAFVAREGRARSIYLGRLDGAPFRLAQYRNDDGQELSGLAVSPDGALVAFVRGGAPNAQGDIPNPRLLTSPPRRQLWVVDTVSGRRQLVGEGSEPQFAPDGKRLIWVTARGVMSAATASVDKLAASAEPILAGSVSMLRFSPDGSQLCFERAGTVEILDLASGDIASIAKPGDANDAGPVWSPDGARIAFRRTLGPQPPRLGDGYAGEFVAKTPWEIWTADAATGLSRRIWQAQPGIGSAWYALDQDPTGTGSRADQILWSAAGSLVFMWEHDGWRHLYAVPASGGDVTLLTPGEGEVETATLSRDGQSLIYSTNIGDPARRHIARVPIAGGETERLTRASSSQWAPTPLADGALAYIDAGWALPPRVIVQGSDGRSAALPVPDVPAAFRSAALVEPRPVEFSATDGQTAYGQLFAPVRSRGCGVIFVHGGIRRQMLPGFHYMDAYSHLYELNQYLVSRGCAVLSVEYRSSIMRGYAFRNAPGWGSAGASEYKDVLGAARFLRAQKHLGIDKLGIYGLSWGGYLTAQALARNSDVFAAGFDMAGVHEFTGNGFEHGPTAFVDRWRSPVYLAAGDDDRNVDFNQAVTLAQALRSRRPHVELVEHVIPNETHDLYLTFDDLVTVYQAGADFLLRHLQPASGPDRR